MLNALGMPDRKVMGGEHRGRNAEQETKTMQVTGGKRAQQI